MRSISLTRTSRAGLAWMLFEWMRPSSQAFCASARVLKKRAAQSHLSIRTEVSIDFLFPSKESGAALLNQRAVKQHDIDWLDCCAHAEVSARQARGKWERAGIGNHDC